MSDTGTLYLIPVPVSDDSGLRAIPSFNLAVVGGLKHFVAEDAKTARKNLKLFGYPDISAAAIEILNEHTDPGEVNKLLAPLIAGYDLGLMSDAGCPGIADPGANLVHACHQKNIRVTPLVGPSAIVLSIMASGFNGQNFAFNGYLPVDKSQRARRLKELEQLSAKWRQAQFFIETPYRNIQMLETILSTLQPETELFIGKHIGGDDAWLRAKTVRDWKRDNLPDLHKVPVVFGIFR